MDSERYRGLEYTERTTHREREREREREIQKCILAEKIGNNRQDQRETLRGKENEE